MAGSGQCAHLRTRPVSRHVRGRGSLRGSSGHAGSPGGSCSTRGWAPDEAPPHLPSTSSGPAQFDPLGDQPLLIVGEQGRRVPHGMRPDALRVRERDKRARSLADVPLDRVQPAAAVGDVRRADVPARRNEVFHAHGQQGAQRNLERQRRDVDCTCPPRSPPRRRLSPNVSTDKLRRGLALARVLPPRAGVGPRAL